MNDEVPMEGDMSPEAAAQFATEGPEAGHMPAEGMDPSAGRPWYLEAVRNTSPNPPIEQVGSFEDLREHWQSYGVRGFQKLGNVDDAEAWVDILKFGIGFMLDIFDGGEEPPDGGDSSSGAREGEFDPSQIDDEFREGSAS